MKRTLMQFGDPGAELPQEEEEELVAVECPTCGNHFSGDARFCPFDGDALVASPDWDPAGDPLIGTVIDARYEVLEVLGEGGMGTVYRARHATLGRTFAIKALRRDLSQDSELAVRFIQEAKAAAAVSHPSVVQITDFGSLPSGQPYFVMELLEGRALSRIIREEGALPPARAANIARQVADALAAAHAVGVIHRDLKPDNVHVGHGAGDRELVKVLDFGLAKVAGSSRLTRQGMVFGTPHYMSPEQAAGEPIDHRVDVYALGVVLYEMITGRLPFEADSFMGVLTKHIYMDPIPPSRVLGESAELGSLERITLKCLEKKPSQRYASMAEAIEDLERVPAAAVVADVRRDARELSGSTRDLGPPSLPVRPRWPLAVGGGLALMVALGLMVWAIGGNDSTAHGAATSAAVVAPTPPPKVAPEPPSTEVRPVVVPTTAPTPEPPAPSTRTVAARPAPTHKASAVPTRTKPPRPAPKAGSGEIINPWGD